jgi:uncharacterized protein (DUF58 family)
VSLKLENIAQYSSIEFIANQIVEGFITGLHKSPFHGFSVEFDQHRLYNAGESTKHIDWKLYARTDKMFVKKFEEETNLRCQIVIDHSSSMFFPFSAQVSLEKPNKITFAIYAAGVLITLLSKQRDAFGVSFVSDKIDFMSETKSNFAHKKYILNLLEREFRQGQNEVFNTKIDGIIHQLAEQIHKRSLVVILTDLFSSQSSEQELIQSLRHLKHCKHEVILFHIFDKTKEVELDFPNRPFKFIDLETKEELKLSPSNIKELYQHAVKEKIENIKTACNLSAIDFVEADISTCDSDLQSSFNKILIPYFIKRTRMSR